MNSIIYLDNAATTKTDEAVLEKMIPFFRDNYGNPSSVYSIATKSKSAINEARRQTARLIGASQAEIYFTGGGSESDNWALKAVYEAFSHKGKHIITTKIEHHAILHTCEYLERMGAEITYLDVDAKGFISLDQLKNAIRPDTILISIMTANNEIGTIEPIREIGEIANAQGILFHTDAVQAFGHIPINVDECHIDLLSASGHKIYGPKGVGLLYIRKGTRIRSFIHGGSQEYGRRAGTENVPAIVGFGEAACLAEEHMQEWAKYEAKLRDYCILKLQENIPDIQINGDSKERLPNNIHLCIAGVEGESVLILLDQKGICASAGSACTSGSLDPSHVLTAIGIPWNKANGSLRLTISHETTKEEIDKTIEELKAIVSQLRGSGIFSEGSLWQKK